MKFMYDWKGSRKLYWKEDFPYKGVFNSVSTTGEIRPKYNSKTKFSIEAMLEKMLEQNQK